MVHRRKNQDRSTSGPGAAGWRWLVSAVVVLVVGVAVLALFDRVGEKDGPEPEEPPQTEALSLVRFSQPQQALDLVDQLATRFDPVIDSAETEVLTFAAQAQLKALGKLIEHPQSIDREHLANLLTEEFSCQPLVPATPKKVFGGRNISVRQWENGSPAAGSEESHYRGVPGFVLALKELVNALGEGANIRSKFKLTKIDASERFFTTRVLFEVFNRAARSSVEQNATWRCQWAFPSGDGAGKPRLMQIRVEKYQEILADADGGTLFTDCTESAMGQNSCYREQVLPGINHWLERTTRVPLVGHHGFALGDVNGDGLEDLYVCDAFGLANRLYMQNTDGTVTERAAEARVNWLEHSTSALLVDLDNDGDQDLVVASIPSLLVAKNDGRGQFTLTFGTSDTVYPMSMCAADYDKDGDLDIYICEYTKDPSDLGLPIPIPYHDANNGGSNRLLRNDGNFEFTDVTAASGLDMNNTRFSFAASWEDYDNDGDFDLYVANDFGRNNLYRNNNQHFTDVAPEAGVEDVATGMAVTWGDYNRDGLLDLYVSNMFSSAGNRVAYQRGFASGVSIRSVADLQRTARGNTLFANAGSNTFHDVTKVAAVNMGRWAWASRFADLNNDGWLDLVVANGFVTMENSDDL